MNESGPTEVDIRHIRDKILDYLSRQSFSEKKLLRKVTDLKHRYPQTERYYFYTVPHVQAVLDELKRTGLVNDRQYARDTLRQLLDRKNGIRRIREKMYRRLIPCQIIDEVLGEWETAGKPQDYRSIIRETSRKYQMLRARYPSERDRYSIRHKLFAYVSQKGYSVDEIKRIVGTVLDNH